jgi:hypothetical protein
LAALAMRRITNLPLLVFFLSFATLWVAAEIGAHLRGRLRLQEEDHHKDFDVVLAAALTLLGLIIGFSFSMVIGRYDQRKNYEENEANAIGTEYLRAKLLPDAEATKVRELLKNYLEERILFYQASTEEELRSINNQTTQLQNALWSIVEVTAEEQRTPTIALVASGMNDVLNAQGYTQAAWWDRLPTAAWLLLIIIAIFCNTLVGYGARRRNTSVLVILPLVISISFFLIADIDSPRRGLIRVVPQNLLSLRQSLPAN